MVKSNSTISTFRPPYRSAQMPKLRRNSAPERIDVAINHSTCVGLRPIVSLIVGASTPSISQTLNINVKATVDRINTIQCDFGWPGVGSRLMRITPRSTCMGMRTGEESATGNGRRSVGRATGSANKA